MFKNIFAFALYLFFFAACDNHDSASDADAIAYKFIEEVSIETRSGASGCFEIIFPLTIDFPGENSQEIESFREAKQAIKEWRKENPNGESRPQLAFPIELINEEGAMISIADRLELRRLRKECLKESYNNKEGKRCFKIIYPITILFPDGTSQLVNDRKETKNALRKWKKDSPSAERPTIGFPIEVIILENESTVTVGSKEELRNLKKSCT